MRNHYCVQFSDEGILLALKCGLESAGGDRKIKRLCKSGHLSEIWHNIVFTEHRADAEPLCAYGNIYIYILFKTSEICY